MEEVAVSINGQSYIIFFIRRWHSFTRTRRLAGHVIGLDRRRPVRREGGTGETAAYAVLVPKKHSPWLISMLPSLIAHRWVGRQTLKS